MTTVTFGHKQVLGIALLGVFVVTTAGTPDFDSAQTAAIFKAAGFTARGGQQTRCNEDPPTLSYRAGTNEPADLNRDGRPEAWVKEGSLFCYGNTAEFFVLLARDKNDNWVTLLEGVGIPVELEARHNGWPDIMVGGPGERTFPVYVFDGRVYVRSRGGRQ